MGYIYLIIALVFNAIANILLKIGSQHLHLFKEINFFDALLRNYQVIIGLALFACNVVFYAIALSKLPLSFAYPLMVGGGFLIITLFSLFQLQETVQTIQIVGILLVFVGILFITLKQIS